MRFQNAIVLVSLGVVCFMLAARSAKADTIVTIQDLTDAVTASGPATSNCLPNTELCTITLTPPSSGATVSSTTLPVAFHMVEGGTLGGVAQPISDGLNHLLLTTLHQLTFQSDPPIAGDPSLPGACVPNLIDCVIETGLPQLAGTVTWSDNTVYDIYVESDVEPEPATLILFGSGLALAGMFIRRRQLV